MASINDLNLIDEDVPEVRPDELPSQQGLRFSAPQPAAYRIRLPDGAISGVFETFQTESGQRLAAVFKDDAAMTLVATGHPLRYARISNAEREVRGVKVNDFAYFLRALGHGEPLKGNTAYATALLRYPSGEFIADILWDAYCSPEKDVYREGKVEKGVKGCGQRYGLEAYTRRAGGEVLRIPQDTAGLWQEQFECTCGAIVRAFPRLANFRAA